jgi:signal transduction histidine kinase
MVERQIEGIWNRGASAALWIRSRPAIHRTIVLVGGFLLAIVLGLLFRTAVPAAALLMLLVPPVAANGLLFGVRQGWIAVLVGGLFGLSFLILPETRQVGWAIDHAAGLLLYLISAVAALGLTRIHESQRERMEQLAGSLEQRVGERTAELKAATEELTGICYTISHDLRAPMRNIVGSSRVLVEDHLPSLDPEVRELVEGLGTSANRMGRLVDDLLSYTRIGHTSVRREWVDLSLSSAAIVAKLQSREWPFSSLDSIVEPGLVVTGDKSLLPIALEQLIRNAMKYAKPGELLYLEIGEEVRAGKRVISVRDNGIGFDMRFAHKVFEPFQRLHRDTDYSGTGIGLAIAKKVIDLHGGEIGCTSVPGVGSTFYFTLGERLTDPMVFD